LERGTYQHPELYGMPPELGMDYDAERQRESNESPSPLSLPDGEHPLRSAQPDAPPRE
jgi:hypothetical protein